MTDERDMFLFNVGCLVMANVFVRIFGLTGIKGDLPNCAMLMVMVAGVRR